MGPSVEPATASSSQPARWSLRTRSVRHCTLVSLQRSLSPSAGLPLRLGLSLVTASARQRRSFPLKGGSTSVRAWPIRAWFVVVALDLRGHGRSEVMPRGAYTPADYVADIEALIATKYPGQKFILVGHSMGRWEGRSPYLVPAEGLEPPTNGLQNRCSTTELSRRRLRRSREAISGRRLYRSGWPQSTDGWVETFTTTQGTGPPPPGLHRGRLAAGTAADTP
jgi:hypothetical protein